MVETSSTGIYSIDLDIIPGFESATLRYDNGWPRQTKIVTILNIRSSLFLKTMLTMTEPSRRKKEKAGIKKQSE